MRTKKDFVRAARLVAAIPKASCRENTATLFAVFFREENPRFDVERFMFACGAETVKIGALFNALAKEAPRHAA